MANDSMENFNIMAQEAARHFERNKDAILARLAKVTGLTTQTLGDSKAGSSLDKSAIQRDVLHMLEAEFASLSGTLTALEASKRASERQIAELRAQIGALEQAREADAERAGSLPAMSEQEHGAKFDHSQVGALPLSFILPRVFPMLCRVLWRVVRVFLVVREKIAHGVRLVPAPLK
jgi:hypothetical protein